MGREYPRKERGVAVFLSIVFCLSFVRCLVPSLFVLLEWSCLRVLVLLLFLLLLLLFSASTSAAGIRHTQIESDIYSNDLIITNCSVITTSKQD